MTHEFVDRFFLKKKEGAVQNKQRTGLTSKNPGPASGMPQMLSGNRVFGSSHIINHTVPSQAGKKPVLAKQVRCRAVRMSAVRGARF